MTLTTEPGETGNSEMLSKDALSIVEVEHPTILRAGHPVCGPLLDQLLLQFLTTGITEQQLAWAKAIQLIDCFYPGVGAQQLGSDKVRGRNIKKGQATTFGRESKAPKIVVIFRLERSEERRVGKECRSRC